MKKLSLLALFVLISTMTFAQIEVKLGGKAGLNVANLSSDKDTKSSTLGGLDNTARVGFNAGITADAVLFEYLGLGAEVLYSQQGTYQSGEVANVKTSASTNLDYVNVPLLIKGYYKGLGVYTGVQPGFLVSAKEIKKLGDIKTETDLLDNNLYRKVDFSIPFGISYQSSVGVNIDARYNFGLTSVFDKGDNASDLTPKNRVFQLSAGFRF